MKACKLRIAGKWGHFRRPETNNQPLTHDFITKTALLGLIGAVLGKSRLEMKELFPILSQALLYSVYPGLVKKESCSFTMQSGDERSPRKMEFLKNPDYTIFLALKDEIQIDLFNEFVLFVKESRAKYNPVLGLHNCPIDKLELLGVNECTEKDGNFSTYGFVPLDLSNLRPSGDSEKRKIFRFGYENLPTYQDSDWWNYPEKYIKVGYVSNNELNAKGKHFIFEPTGEAICLI